ncbi:MAG TPA: glycoside hydrolase family 13 protein [Bdellovibrionota bacterium]|nr:glycoside hydrolase family 13 protein [Bdellovibrionota bacterium]
MARSWMTALLVALAPIAAHALEGHDTFDPEFRSPPGAVPHDSRRVRIRFGSQEATQVRMRVWDSAIRTESWYPLKRFAPGSSAWEHPLELPRYPTILYYHFEVKLPGATRYYVARDPKFLAGGRGRFVEARDDFKSFRLTVYDPSFRVPDWLQGAVVYQIFPDRFRNGNRANDPPGRMGPPVESQAQYFGGDLEGVTQKLDYLKSLGVTAIYLNPIFKAGTYHRYDTHDYLAIDPSLGGEGAYQALAARAREAGVRLILDGVFNHVGAEHPFFDLSGGSSELGACESTDSPYRSWFYLPHFQNAAMRRGAGGAREPVLCGGMTYEGWAGSFALPKLDVRAPGVRGHFFAGRGAVAPTWIARGASGFRLDAAGEADSGWMNEPDNGFWKGMRRAIREVDSDSVLIGEEWGYASPWLLGHDWDSSMNYRFRTSVLNWLFDSCSGDGCEGGRKFVDNDSNDQSVLGSIHPIGERELLDRLGSIEEDTPPQAWHAMMNLVDSHDTSRILWTLKKISGDSPELARRKLFFLVWFQFTYPGAPTIYYGNEAGLSADSQWRGGVWIDDPYNRLSYPWQDQGGAGGDPEVISHFTRLARLRGEIPALRNGSFAPVLVDEPKRVLAFVRENGSSRAWVALNRSLSEQTVRLMSDRLGPDGARYRDAESGAITVVRNGALALGKLPGLSGRILIPE